MQNPPELYDPLELVTKIYEGLSDKEIEEIEQIILARNEFFTKPQEDEQESSR